MRPSRTIAAVAAVAALLIAGGCGGGDDGDAPATAAVTIAGFEFDPDPVRVRAGATITWTNADEAPHTAEADSGAPAPFDTGRLGLGDQAEVTLETPGTYQYFCVFHRFMTGTVEVVE
ncbi:MAG: plastocyanin/azurin family copper-binding protein [Thermoleophilaceae bacterium]